MNVRSLLLAIGCAAWLSASALEVGPLQLQRPAGQPPFAEIPITDSASNDPAALRARLATPEGYRVAGMRYVPALRSITITPQTTPSGRLVLRLDGLPSSSEVGELDLLLLVGDRVSLSLNEYRVDLRGPAREFAPSAPGTRLASQGAAPPAVGSVSAPPAQRPSSAQRIAAAASQPATGAATESTATVDSATAAQVEQALAAWAKAWSDRNVDGYLAAYAPNYEPPNRRMSHAEWEKQRRSRIASKQTIEVAMSDTQLRRRGDTVVATFQQRYRGDNLVENSRKRIVFAREQDRWLIQEEVELR